MFSGPLKIIIQWSMRDVVVKTAKAMLVGTRVSVNPDFVNFMSI
jgi:hypothetical protein